jgi:hypothetical protein
MKICNENSVKYQFLKKTIDVNNIQQGMQLCRNIECEVHKM